jgi:hypothetical protein
MIVNFGESDMVGQQFTYALVHRLSTRMYRSGYAAPLSRVLYGLMLPG